ncbi:MAG: PrsW family glutamic-type intramembrane protease, partial [Xanthobacteraceae bacterium]
IFPLVGDRSTWKREHLLPIFATIVSGVALIAVPLPGLQISATPEINAAWQVYLIVAVYIAFLVNYYINQMCAHPKPGWLLAIVSLFTFAMLGSRYWHAWYNLFYNVLPAAEWQKSPHLFVRLAGWWFGTGLCEEGFKSWPLFGLVVLGAALGWLSRRANGRLGGRLASLQKRIGLSEPLDGIVLGVASGSGFFIAETLLQYVPHAMQAQKFAGSQAFEGLVLLLGRGLPNIAEHCAWCGLFGYFIGLAVLQPRTAAFLIPVGWLSAAALHAGWDGIGSITNSNLFVAVFLVGVGVLSYALLAGAIFHARDISPNQAYRLADGAEGVATSVGHPPPIPLLVEAELPDGD